MSRILTVDDSPSMRDMVRISLTDAGYQVTQAGDGQEALQIARRVSFDLVLSDLNMPHMDGIALVRALRSESAYRCTPILLLTTESAVERKHEGRDAGATGWIVKPFDPERLVTTLQRLLR